MCFNKTFVGNTILIDFGKNKYALCELGALWKFVVPEKIDEFISMIGNNDAPYPYAFSKIYIYEFSEFKYMDKKDFKRGEIFVTDQGQTLRNDNLYQKEYPEKIKVKKITEYGSRTIWPRFNQN